MTQPNASSLTFDYLHVVNGAAEIDRARVLARFERNLKLVIKSGEERECAVRLCLALGNAEFVHGALELVFDVVKRAAQDAPGATLRQSSAFDLIALSAELEASQAGLAELRIASTQQPQNPVHRRARMVGAYLCSISLLSRLASEFVALQSAEAARPIGSIIGPVLEALNSGINTLSSVNSEILAKSPGKTLQEEDLARLMGLLPI